MYWMITAVFKTTIGWLVEKGREKVAEKLKYGDVTDQQLRGIIIREIDDVKSGWNIKERVENKYKLL